MSPETGSLPLLAVVLAGPEVRDAGATLAHLGFASRCLVLARDRESARAYREAGAEVVRLGEALTLEAAHPERWPDEALEATLRAHPERVLCIEGEERPAYDFAPWLGAWLEAGDGAFGEARRARVRIRHFQCGVYLEHGGWSRHETRLFLWPSTLSEAGALRAALLEARGGGTPPALDTSIVEQGHRHLSDRLRHLNLVTGRPEPLVGPPRPFAWLCESVRAFTRCYLRRRGYRDGVSGLLAAALLAFEIFLRRVKSWEAARR